MFHTTCRSTLRVQTPMILSTPLFWYHDSTPRYATWNLRSIQSKIQ
jgi:hypothetical protein